MSFVEEKFAFIRRVSEIDRSGQLNKGKLASIIYDLVYDKTKLMRKEIDSLQDLGTPDKLNEEVGQLSNIIGEMSEKILNIEKKLEDHDKILESLNKKRGRKPKLKTTKEEEA